MLKYLLGRSQHTPIFSDCEISSDLHRSPRVPDRRLWRGGGGQTVPFPQSGDVYGYGPIKIWWNGVCSKMLVYEGLYECHAILICINDATNYPNYPEHRTATHEICWAQHRARLASLNASALQRSPATNTGCPKS